MSQAEGSPQATTDASLEESRAELLALQQSLDHAKKGKMDDTTIASIQKAVDDKRAQHKAAKPLPAQLKVVENQLAKLETKVAKHNERTLELQAAAEEAQRNLARQKEAAQLANEKLEKARSEAALLREKLVTAPAPGGEAEPFKGADPKTVEWLGTQPPEVVESFRKHYASLPAPGGSEKAERTAPEDIPVGFDEADLIEGGLVDALLGSDDSDPEHAKFAKQFTDAIAKRGVAAV